MKRPWDKIEEMEDYFISYLLYREGKSIDTIARIRNESKNKIENDLIKSRAVISQKKTREKRDFLLEIMSLDKSSRIERIENLKEDERSYLVDQIYKRYTKFKSVEDRMILIWLIGELDSDKLLPFLKMELKSNRFNQKRLACSALGKLERPKTRYWLHEMVYDENPQVRQYAVKALKNIGNHESLVYLKRQSLRETKEYVKIAIEETVDNIENR